MQNDKCCQTEVGPVVKAVTSVEPKHHREYRDDQNVFQCPCTRINRVDGQRNPEYKKYDHQGFFEHTIYYFPQYTLFARFLIDTFLRSHVVRGNAYKSINFYDNMTYF